MPKVTLSGGRRHTLLVGLVSSLGWAVGLPPLAVGQGPGTDGGQWHYLGGDAWHTRYAPADQIKASNFEQLEVA